MRRAARMFFPTFHTDRAQVYILFYKPTAEDPLQNRLVALFDGPFSHVEMAFPERFGEEPWEKDIWGSSVLQGERVFFKPKTYQREGYASCALELSLTQMLRLKAFCRHQAERAVPFSVAAMYAAYLPVQIMRTEATFCSKHVALALQCAGIQEVAGMNPALATPSRLYKALSGCKQNSTILQVVPSRMGIDTAACRANMVRDLVSKDRAASQLLGG